MGLPAPAYAIDVDVQRDGNVVPVIVIKTSGGSPITSQTMFEWRKLTTNQQTEFNRVVNNYGGTVPLAGPVAGKETVRLSALVGSPSTDDVTGYQADGGVQHATLYVDGVKYSFKINEQRVTTYASLIGVLNSKLSGIATVSLDANDNLLITSATTGGGSSVKIVRDGNYNIFRNLTQFRNWSDPIPGVSSTSQMMRLNHLSFSLLALPIREPLYGESRSDIINRVSTSDLPFLRFLDTVGDGTGEDNANKNFSVAGSPALGSTIYKLAPGPGQFLVINSLNVHYSDSGSFNYDEFGAGPTLTNGVIIQAYLNGRMHDFTNGNPVKRNTGWQHISSNVLLNTWANPGDSIVAQLNVSSFGRPLILNGDLGDRLEAVLSDDFSILDDFHFVAHGFT